MEGDSHRSSLTHWCTVHTNMALNKHQSCMDHLGKKLYKFPFAQKYCWLNLGRQVPYHWEVSPSPFPIPYNRPPTPQSTEADIYPNPFHEARITQIPRLDIPKPESDRAASPVNTDITPQSIRAEHRCIQRKPVMAGPGRQGQEGSRPVWITQWIVSQPEIHSKTQTPCTCKHLALVLVASLSCRWPGYAPTSACHRAHCQSSPQLYL